MASGIECSECRCFGRVEVIVGPEISQLPRVPTKRSQRGPNKNTRPPGQSRREIFGVAGMLRHHLHTTVKIWGVSWLFQSHGKSHGKSHLYHPIYKRMMSRGTPKHTQKTPPERPVQIADLTAASVKRWGMWGENPEKWGKNAQIDRNKISDDMNVASFGCGWWWYSSVHISGFIQGFVQQSSAWCPNHCWELSLISPLSATGGINPKSWGFSNERCVYSSGLS